MRMFLLSVITAIGHCYLLSWAEGTVSISCPTASKRSLSWCSTVTVFSQLQTEPAL